MGLPEKFDRRLKSGLGLHAVWPPATPLELGDILQRKRDGTFNQIANLREFNVGFNPGTSSKKMSLSYQAKGVSTTVIQAGAQVDLGKLNTDAKAQLKIEFKEDDGYYIRTPTLKGNRIVDLMRVGKSVAKAKGWNHAGYYIISQLYRAEDLVFLGSESKNRTVIFEGAGNAIIQFFTLGASANIQKISASSVSLEIIGEGGPIAMDVVRIRRDGGVY